MSVYDIDALPRVLDLTNKSTCVPADQFIPLMKMVVFKQDAINLGILCFCAGIAFWMFVVWLDQRWKKE